MEDDTLLLEEDLKELQLMIEDRLTELREEGITRLSRYLTKNYKSEYL